MRNNIAFRFALVWVALLAVACTGPETGPPEVGDPAPPFSARTLDGTSVGSADLRGAPYMLNVWATWCGPCRREMPELQELHDTYADRGFRVVGVSVDTRSAGAQIQTFIDDLGIGFPIYHDPSSAILDAYFLPGLPGTFLVDAEGVIVRKWTGPFRPMDEDVQEVVRALLLAPTPGEA